MLGAKFPTPLGNERRTTRSCTVALATKRSRQQPHSAFSAQHSPQSGSGAVNVKTLQKRKPPFLIRVLSCFQEWDNWYIFLLSWTSPLDVGPKPQKQRCRQLARYSWNPKKEHPGPKGLNSTCTKQSTSSAQNSPTRGTTNKHYAILSHLFSSLSFSQTPSLLGSIRSTLG